METQIVRKNTQVVWSPNKLSLQQYCAMLRRDKFRDVDAFERTCVALKQDEPRTELLWAGYFLRWYERTGRMNE